MTQPVAVHLVQLDLPQGYEPAYQRKLELLLTEVSRDWRERGTGHSPGSTHSVVIEHVDPDGVRLADARKQAYTQRVAAAIGPTDLRERVVVRHGWRCATKYRADLAAGRAHLCACVDSDIEVLRVQGGEHG